MRVVHIASGYPSLAAPMSGTFVRQQVLALARHGIGVTVFHMVPFAPPGISQYIPKWESYRRTLTENGEALGVRVVRVPYLAFPGQVKWGYPDLWMAASIRRALSRLMVRPDLLHAHCLFPVGSAVVQVGRQLGIPVVSTAHGSDVNYYAELNDHAARKVRSVARNSDRVVTVSRALSVRLAEIAGVLAVPLPIGVDLGAFVAQTQTTAREQLGLEHDRTYLLYVGALIKEKGVYELIEAFTRLGRRFPETDLILVGSGPEQGKLTTIVEATGYRQGRIRLVGEIPHDQVARWMSAASALVLPSYSEGMPTVVVEAGALGLPVVATAVGGIPELLDHGETGLLVSPQNVDDLATAISAVVSAPEWAQSMAGRLQTLVRDRFDVNLNAHTLVRCYTSLLGPDPAGPHRGRGT